MRVSEHLFVRESAPPEINACRGCGWPGYFCICNPEEEELPSYRGADPMLYAKERN